MAWRSAGCKPADSPYFWYRSLASGLTRCRAHSSVRVLISCAVAAGLLARFPKACATASCRFIFSHSPGDTCMHPRHVGTTTIRGGGTAHTNKVQSLYCHARRRTCLVKPVLMGFSVSRKTWT